MLFKLGVLKNFDTNAGVFLRVLRYFSEFFFYRKPTVTGSDVKTCQKNQKNQNNRGIFKFLLFLVFLLTLNIIVNWEISLYVPKQAKIGETVSPFLVNQ